MTNSNLVSVFNGTIQNTHIQLCNARDLHSFLEVKNYFNDWIKDRISDYGFVENEDYIIVTERTAGRPRKEYHITLDMGKELGMVERNEKGRQIRKYFIAVEKQQKQNSQPNLPLVEEKKFTFEFTQDEISTLLWLWFIAEKERELIGNLAPALRAIGSHFAPTAESHVTEYKFSIERARKILLNLSQTLNVTPREDTNLSRVLPKIRTFNSGHPQRPRLTRR